MTMNTDHFHTHDNFKIAGKIIDQVSALKQRNAELENEIAALKENHKKEVEQLLMKISGLEKLVETADKLLKPKGGFTIKDIKFGGVKLEGINTNKKEGE